MLQGKHTEALSHLEKVIAIEPTAELRHTLHRYAPLDPWVSSRLFLSWCQWLLGYPDRSAENRRLALAIAEKLGRPFTLCWALCYVSWGHQFGRDREKTQTTAARALTLGAEKGFPGLNAWAKVLDGWALAESGQSEQGMTAIHQGLEDLRPQGALSDRNGLLPLLAEASGRTGRPDEGLKALAEAQEFADATGETFFIAELYRLKGELLLQHDPTAAKDGEAWFHQALVVVRRQQARSLELRAAMSLARLWSRQGQTHAARELAAAVYATFTEGFQTHDLQTARAWLEQDDAPSSRPPCPFRPFVPDARRTPCRKPFVCTKPAGPR